MFLYRFFQLLRCNRGQTDHQRWMIKYEIARQKAVDAWLEATTPRPLVGDADVVTQIDRLRDAARDRQRLEVRRDWVGPAGELAAAVNTVARPEATEAMRHSAIEHVWRVQRRGRADQFPISDNLSALMALVMADLSESQRETLMNLIYQRNIALTALTLQQLRDFLITLFHAPKSSLENPSWSQELIICAAPMLLWSLPPRAEGEARLKPYARVKAVRDACEYCLAGKWDQLIALQQQRKTRLKPTDPMPAWLDW